MKYDFGLVGLGVMGRNFILNVAENGFSVIGLSSKRESIDTLESDGKDFTVKGTEDAKEFIESLSSPRKIMLLVPAGDPVDSVIDSFIPFLSPGDIIIDGGNSHYDDTERRYNKLKNLNFHFLGTGVSGGSKGARLGPSIMPGGDKEAYELIRPIFEKASAKVSGDPCVSFLGKTSAGHYVKMIHNGIEYAMMQLISEVYHVLRYGMDKSNDEIHQIFSTWNEGTLNSYLIEITGDIFSAKDGESDTYLIDMILDKAKQKGTGKWTSQSAMDFGVAVPTIDSSVSMRIISSFKDVRGLGEEIYPKSNPVVGEVSVGDLEKALIYGFTICYAQGLSQLKVTSLEKGYSLDYREICKIWRGGCIIRASLLEEFMNAFSRNSKLENLIFDKEISNMIKENESIARKVSVYCINNKIPSIALNSTISYLDAITHTNLPMNLIQAQRDCFGEHTFERIDKPGTYHNEYWQG